MRMQFYALLSVLALFGVVVLYVREFDYFSNTIHAGRLVAGALVAGVCLSAGLLLAYRERFQPWEKHLPEALLIFFAITLVMPLVFSLLNRSYGTVQYESFQFLEEKPYYASAYGALKGERIEPSGYFLLVKNDKGGTHRFRYQQQAYFPLSRAGDTISLPMHKGLLRFERMVLK
ncbi:MAG: hypothetical protein SFV52_15910 [Saprospiraceae bacterium]|nr:hypothetical protein [Saprospiraceae bacterium]